MVLVLEKKFLEGVWWKYGLAVAGAKIFLWLVLIYKMRAGIDWREVLSAWIVIVTFFTAAFLPFALGRLQLRKVFWFGLVGFILADAAYVFLTLIKVGRLMSLLPFIAFLQLYVTCLGLGIVIELGGYAYKKLTE